MRAIPITLLAAALAIGGAGCGDDGADSAPAPQLQTAKQEGRPAPSDRPKPRPEPGIGITTAASPYGEVLFDEERRAIYLFDAEESERPECYGECAAAWPPVLTEGRPAAAGKARAGLLGTTERDDGSTQVTYAGHPLYYYVDDPPGQVLCHDIAEFGGLWLAVQPEGEAAPS